MGALEKTILHALLASWMAGCVTEGGDSGATTPSTESRPASRHSSGPIDPSKTQLITVVSEDWTSFHAILRRYERPPGGTWTELGAAIDVVLGYAGYGWGRGLHGPGPPAGRNGPAKREGDGRSPAGAFELGAMYGYQPAPEGVSLPYVEATPALRCVDDPRSRHYNRIVSTKTQERDWYSAELMRRKDDLYEIAIVVSHNVASPEPGAGSCIFLHVWEGPEVAVRGCTAMSKPELDALSKWLEPGAAVLVALPHPEYDALQRTWHLPAHGLAIPGHEN